MISSLRPISAAIGQAAGDMLAFNGTSWARLPAGVGENGKVLTVVAGVPAWVAPTVYDDSPVFYKDCSRALTGNSIRPAANSTTAIQVQQADGTVVGNFDTSNKRLGINTIAPASSLHSYSLGSFGLELTASGTPTQEYRPGIKQELLIDSASNATYAFHLQYCKAGLLSLGSTNIFAFGLFGTCRTTGNNAPTYAYYALGTTTAYNDTHVLRLTSNSVGINLTSTITPSYTLSFGGNAERQIGLERHTTNSTTGNNLTTQAGGCKASQTNIGGGALNLDDGTGTGNAYGGGVFIRNYIAGVSGTSDNSQATVFQARNNQIAWFAGALVSQQSHIADPSGGATVDAEARSAINSILAALENYSLLKSS